MLKIKHFPFVGVAILIRKQKKGKKGEKGTFPTNKQQRYCEVKGDVPFVFPVYLWFSEDDIIPTPSPL